MFKRAIGAAPYNSPRKGLSAFSNLDVSRTDWARTVVAYELEPTTSSLAPCVPGQLQLPIELAPGKEKVIGDRHPVRREPNDWFHQAPPGETEGSSDQGKTDVTSGDRTRPLQHKGDKGPHGKQHQRLDHDEARQCIPAPAPHTKGCRSHDRP